MIIQRRLIVSHNFGETYYIKNNNNEKKIFIIKIMHNQFTEYKTLLQTFSLQEQIDEINMIKKLDNKKHIENKKDWRYDKKNKRT